MRVRLFTYFKMRCSLQAKRVYDFRGPWIRFSVTQKIALPAQVHGTTRNAIVLAATVIIIIICCIGCPSARCSVVCVGNIGYAVRRQPVRPPTVKSTSCVHSAHYNCLLCCNHVNCANCLHCHRDYCLPSYHGLHTILNRAAYRRRTRHACHLVPTAHKLRYT